MKNSKIYKIIFLSFFCLIFTNCSDFLDEKVTTQYSEEQIFSSAEGLESVVTGMYASMANINYYSGSFQSLVNPVSGRFNSSQTANVDATSLNCTPTNINLPLMWAQMYETINIANKIIYNVENSTQTFTNRETVLGNAYFVRGVVYFDLVRLFGGVPLRLEPSTTNNLNKAKSTKQQVYSQIISDLEIAKNKMPDADAIYGRPKKWAAFGYLAKVYMNLAAEDGGNASYWVNAKNELSNVISKYSLVPNYATLFASAPGSLVVENTVESIFELQFAQIGAQRNSEMVRFYTPSNSTFLPKEVITFGRIRPNKEVFTQHRTQYPNDPRIATTFIFDNYQQYTTTGVGPRNVYPVQLTGNFSFPYIKKYLDYSFNGSTTNRNLILFRYADVLLMMAEIENELTGPAAAYTYVNEVLTRARNSALPVATQPVDFSGMTQAEFRTRIMKERQYELLCEGHDWFDTRRRGYDFFLNSIVYPHNSFGQNLTSQVDVIYPVSVKNMLLPIPARELETNQALTPADQNPGY
jgi:starch-binding outer membrane protein, SusD/RagB family